MIRRLTILLLIVGCVTEPEDCAGVAGGDAVEDCFGVCSGDASIDSCGVCSGGTTNLEANYLKDCAGVCGGTSVLSGCDNACNSTAVEDCAGVCGGSDTEDCAGVCGGSDISCADCAGILNGDNVEDNCGVCGGDALSCNQPVLFNFNQSTQQAYYMFIIVKIDDENISPSDWVGAFNNDVCVGARRWDASLCGGGICDVPIIGDGGSDATAGYMTSGDIPSFKIYDASENAYYDAVASENIPWANIGINVIESLNAITISGSN